MMKVFSLNAMTLSLTEFKNTAATVDFSNHGDPKDCELVDASFIGPDCDAPSDSDVEGILMHILSCQAALALILGSKRKGAEFIRCTDKQHQYLLAVSNISQVLV
jgi:hypothetical protein